MEIKGIKPVQIGEIIQNRENCIRMYAGLKYNQLRLAERRRHFKNRFGEGTV
jgi:hypothetical protein